jgi:hypothetical protein
MVLLELAATGSSLDRQKFFALSAMRPDHRAPAQEIGLRSRY